MANGVLESISVVVPSYGRPDALLECLAGIAGQVPAPAEIVCVVRDEDRPTRAALSQLALSIPFRVVSPSRPGLVVALETGLASSTTSLVAFTDDDAVPRPGWLEGMRTHFADDPRVAGVGGRDWVHYGGAILEPRTRRLPASRVFKRRRNIGMVEWTGRLTGGHHGGSGSARDVDVLKGVNMAFRRDALLSVGFDPRLRGSGSQVHNETWPCLELRRLGRRIVYDPAIAVDHYVRSRPAGDDREGASRSAITDSTFNETRAVFRYRSPPGRSLTLVWGLLVGTSLAPGVALAAYLALRRTPDVAVRFRAAAGARMDAYRSLRADRRKPMSRS
jgi:cellulose synthase/poly-beta-1,6-N-acetylglucosamine synthase-like glycosyltransferase